MRILQDNNVVGDKRTRGVEQAKYNQIINFFTRIQPVDGFGHLTNNLVNSKLVVTHEAYHWLFSYALSRNTREQQVVNIEMYVSHAKIQNESNEFKQIKQQFYYYYYQILVIKNSHIKGLFVSKFSQTPDLLLLEQQFLRLARQEQQQLVHGEQRQLVHGEQPQLVHGEQRQLVHDEQQQLVQQVWRQRAVRDEQQH
uniref:Uncharacterized protein n=1 Tax=Glossina austeni TaxID=7395 RepID=A0A1A9VQT2_GLOAU